MCKCNLDMVVLFSTDKTGLAMQNKRGTTLILMLNDSDQNPLRRVRSLLRHREIIPIST